VKFLNENKATSFGDLPKNDFEKMQKAAKILSGSRLFQGINQNEIEGLLQCLRASFGQFKKGQFLLMEGDPVRHIGILFSGSADIIKEDAFGRRSIVNTLGPLDMFAEALVCAEIEESPVSVVGSSDGWLCFIDYKRITTTCSSACAFHSKLIQNMMSILAIKNVMFNKKVDYLLMKGMREKISSYLLDIAKNKKALSFDIPFNREELAEWLSVDRSALSRELSKMKDEGIIDYKKSHFVIKDKEKM
jgi:CRP-like cAMP-binding protein